MNFARRWLALWRGKERTFEGRDHLGTKLGGVAPPLSRSELTVSLCLHFFLVAVFLWTPNVKSGVLPPAVVVVDLVEPRSSSRDVKPKSPRKTVKKKVLPTKDLQQKPKPKPKPKPKEKPKPKQKPKPPPQPDLADVLSDLRKEESIKSSSAVRTPLERVENAAEGSRRGVTISPREAEWRRRVKNHVTRNWVLQPGLKGERLEAHALLNLEESGRLSEVDIVRRSGNPWFDESVERAVRKSDPLPAPQNAGRWIFIFRPEDL